MTSSNVSCCQLREFCLKAAREISSECAGGDVRPLNEAAGCESPLVELLGRQATVIAKGASIDAESFALISKRIDDLISISYSKFYAYIFKDLPFCWRVLYTDASILKFCIVFLASPLAGGNHSASLALSSKPDDALLGQLVQPLDLAIILAGAAGNKRGRRWVEQAFCLLGKIFDTCQFELGSETVIKTQDDSHLPKRLKLSPSNASPSDWETVASFKTNEPFTPPVKNPVRRLEQLSLESFQSYMDRPSDSDLGPEPLIITGVTDDWPARTTNPWCKPAYLLSRTLNGQRLVPVETGRSYVDEGWGQKIIPFAAFLEGYIDRPAVSSSADHGSRNSERTEGGGTAGSLHKQASIAYLAQHQLFAQLPSLRDDIRIPDYCYTAPPPPPASMFPMSEQRPPELEDPILNAWFGPPGTITPLHTDPYHNMLSQVVGRKYVRLYSHLQTPRMAARGVEDGVEMSNTSHFDVGVMEGWDEANGQDEKESQKNAVDFGSIPFLDCILEPGDTLYIPVGWWHYVRGLSVSFSVSFWWN
ncbi:JmjC domain-containing protein 5 [Pyricularia oryzae 70-15]|uniref:JmjC domain-containing protein 5 n=3 Tax=Pyricularia oryzae TaxID=318829 RepID=G4MTF9_PYRO7|nr:JmjC domain-containing protein 5 [Pyricularia oryzae 70-15]EHA54710.1 JmjC domain-containing protein 5 [Pyricularia oryzae 70-15]ELQ37468.1 JmjC domain-containing protein 5 [Pyricularia oryzae Y34]KAI7918094.1 JmjC domain-containing protein 5 [Pyricularia oryzae]KAI7918569.1 JmjC domain-containing protein 5 [Pyricularia oryzae]